MKKALNRIGYYTPFPKTGMTDIPDRELFDALKTFQTDKGFRPTGEARPNDPTIKALNSEETKTQTTQYIWRTVGDDKVRDSHAELNGKIRSFNQSPTPGDDPNCRCWAEPLGFNAKRLTCDLEENEVKELEQSVKDLSDKVNDLLIELNQLIEKHQELLVNAERNLGVRILTFILNLPYPQKAMLNELLQRYFENIINDKLIEAAQRYMQELWAVKEKIKNKESEFIFVFKQLEKTSTELENAKERLEECEKNL